MIDSLLHAKFNLELKKIANFARLENGTYEEIVAYFKRKLELTALEESDELPIAAMASTSGSKPAV